ncbi:MAG: amino acid permease [bacterium]
MMAHSEIQRTVGFWEATGIGLGAIVGGGILALSGTAFATAGPSAIIAFALNGIIAFTTALSFAQMSSAFPESGGAYTFTKKVLSVRAAFAVGWVLWFASIMAGVLYALGFASYMVSAFQSLWPIFSDVVPAWISGRSMILILSAGATIFYTITLSHKTGGGGQWETNGKLIVFFILILTGCWVLLKQPAQAIRTRFTPFWGGGIFGVFQAMGFTFITFQGFDLIAAVAGEVKNPERNIPLSMFLSLGIALVIYLPFLFIIVALGVPQGQSITSLSAMYPDTLVAVAVGNYLGVVGYWLIIVAAILSMLSALYANLLAASRIALAMAQDRTLPRFLSVTDKNSGIPVRSLYVSSAILLISLLAIPDLPAAGAAASLIFLISFTLTHITNILAKWREETEAQDTYQDEYQTKPKVTLPLIPCFGAVCCALIAVFQSISVPAAGKMVSVWFALGFILYFNILAGRAEVVDAMTQAQDPRLVRLRGRSPLVLVPLANPASAKSMIAVANALCPPQVGRVLLLSVVAGSIDWKADTPPSQLLSAQNALREALTASFSSDLSPEALITAAPRPWSEIIRVAHLHRCESLLIGLSDSMQSTINPHLEGIISRVDCDIVFLQAPPTWQLYKVKRILVPIAGKNSHDILRARLLGSLCRSLEREVTYLRVVPHDTSEKELTWIRYKLARFAGDEVPIHPNIEVIRSNDVVSVVKEYAKDKDLVILGIQRLGRRKKAFGAVALEIARVTGGATILISRRD